LQFARAWGCEVTALSTSADKKAESLKFGAHNFLHTADTAAAVKSHAEHFDFILCTVPKAVDWAFYFQLLRADGTFCLVGMAGDKMTVPVMPLVSRNLHLVGGAGCSRIE
jgi:alcohol/geraniol dehydrogenase (NADP+)